MKSCKVTNAAAGWFDLIAILFCLTGGLVIWTSLSKNASYAVNTFAQGMMLITLVNLFQWIRRGSLTDLGMGAKPGRQDLLWGTLGGLLLFFLMYAASWVLEALPWHIPEQSAVDQLSTLKSWWDFLPLLAAVALIAPLSEELFFRAYCLPLFSKKWGINYGSVFAAIFFGSLHFDIWRLLPLSLAGWILNKLYCKTGSLWTSVIAHSLWNGMLALVIFWNASRG